MFDRLQLRPAGRKLEHPRDAQENIHGEHLASAVVCALFPSGLKPARLEDVAHSPAMHPSTTHLSSHEPVSFCLAKEKVRDIWTGNDSDLPETMRVLLHTTQFCLTRKQMYQPNDFSTCICAQQ